MIKVNLCPREEMENPNWWVPDVFIVVVLALAGIYGLLQYEGSFQDEIDAANKQKESFETSYAELKPDLDRAQELKSDTKKLTDLLVGLQSITTSKIEKFKPIIILEHLQSLKPEGVWYKSLTIDSKNSIILEGQAFDNILVAEFAMALRATQNQEADASDLRTQIQFGDLKITGVTTTGKIETNPAGGAATQTMSGYPTFNITLTAVEKVAIPVPNQPVGGVVSRVVIGPRVAKRN